LALRGLLPLFPDLFREQVFAVLIELNRIVVVTGPAGLLRPR
jgi:hypothetical protein